MHRWFSLIASFLSSTVMSGFLSWVHPACVLHPLMVNFWRVSHSVASAFSPAGPNLLRHTFPLGFGLVLDLVFVLLSFPSLWILFFPQWRQLFVWCTFGGFFCDLASAWMWLVSSVHCFWMWFFLLTPRGPVGLFAFLCFPWLSSGCFQEFCFPSAFVSDGLWALLGVLPSYWPSRFGPLGLQTPFLFYLK